MAKCFRFLAHSRDFLCGVWMFFVSPRFPPITQNMYIRAIQNSAVILTKTCARTWDGPLALHCSCPLMSWQLVPLALKNGLKMQWTSVPSETIKSILVLHQALYHSIPLLLTHCPGGIKGWVKCRGQISQLSTRKQTKMYYNNIHHCARGKLA